MDVPVDARPIVEFGVDGREDVRAQGWRHDRLDGLVEDKREEHFVDVVGEGWKREGIGVGFDEVEKKGWRRRDRVDHGLSYW